MLEIETFYQVGLGVAVTEISKLQWHGQIDISLSHN